MNPNYRIRNIVKCAERCPSNIQIFGFSVIYQDIDRSASIKGLLPGNYWIICIWIESSLMWTPRRFAWPPTKTRVFWWIQWDSNERGCKGEKENLLKIQLRSVSQKNAQNLLFLKADRSIFLSIIGTIIAISNWKTNFLGDSLPITTI